ncbi:MAG: hypothetical protein J6D02_00525 [Lachnospira sp.]|nr:hypothetical protein [Lachnospira sp.]
MKEITFNIIKLLISLVFQYSIFMGSFIFAWIAGGECYDFNLIVFWLIFILAFLLGEGGIFLLYTVKPLQRKISKIIYCIIYMGIHITSAVTFCCIYGCIFGVFDNIVEVLL